MQNCDDDDDDDECEMMTMGDTIKEVTETDEIKFA